MKKTDPLYPVFEAALHDYLHGYFSGIGRMGGHAKSDAKSAASRANGCKGGRPRSSVCADCQYSVFTVRKGRHCLYRLRPSDCPYCRPGMSRAKPASLKQSRTGRCNPASDVSRPSKRKKRP